jgi:hypothetical protein
LFWLFYDQNFTKTAIHKLPRVYSKPTESSPLSPFYTEPYKGPVRTFQKWQQTDFPCGELIPEKDLGSRTAPDEVSYGSGTK